MIAAYQVHPPNRAASPTALGDGNAPYQKNTQEQLRTWQRLPDTSDHDFNQGTAEFRRNRAQFVTGLNHNREPTTIAPVPDTKGSPQTPKNPDESEQFDGSRGAII